MQQEQGDIVLYRKGCPNKSSSCCWFDNIDEALAFKGDVFNEHILKSDREQEEKPEFTVWDEGVYFIVMSNDDFRTHFESYGSGYHLKNGRSGALLGGSTVRKVPRLLLERCLSSA